MSINPVSFVELDWYHCRWPVSGDGRYLMYCGDHIERHSSYCTAHRMMAYTSKPESSRAEAEMRGREMARERRMRAA